VPSLCECTSCAEGNLGQVTLCCSSSSIHISNAYTEAARYNKTAGADAVNLVLHSSSETVYTNSLKLKVAPSPTSNIWQVSGVSKDRDGISIVRGVYNSTNGRCVRHTQAFRYGDVVAALVFSFGTPSALSLTATPMSVMHDISNLNQLHLFAFTPLHCTRLKSFSRNNGVCCISPGECYC
jgi:hypothetical protein